MEIGRWVGVGGSDKPEGGAAGAEAVGSALAGRSDARLLIVFASDALELQPMLSAIRAGAPGAELIGCTTAGEISAAGPTDRTVVVTALGGDGFDVATSHGDGAAADLRAAGAAAAGCIADVSDGEDRSRAVVLLSDSLSGDQQEIVRGAYGTAGASVPLVGGCAGDSGRMERTLQLYGDQVLDDAVVGAAISSTGRFGIGVRHGWQPVGEPMLVTGSEGTEVRTLDLRPALDVYLERLGRAEDPPAPGEFAALAQTHPLGLTGRRGELPVRFVGGADLDSRALQLIASIPEGTLAWLMEGGRDSVLEATDGACEEALAGLAGEAPLGMLAFDCVGRRGVLGDELESEVRRVADHARGAAVAGFYTYGEIARTTGIAGFHNQTMVVLAVS